MRCLLLSVILACALPAAAQDAPRNTSPTADEDSRTTVEAHNQSTSAMTIERTREIMEAYVSNHDPRYLASDAMFIDTATGQRHEGREEIGAMLQHICSVAFDARAEDTRLVIGEGKATLEATFAGTHIGEFAGIPATGKQVRVPLCVVYDLNEDGITEGRIYMQAAVMMQQLGVSAATETH